MYSSDIWTISYNRAIHCLVLLLLKVLEDLLVDRQFKTIFFSTIIKINGSFIVAAKRKIALNRITSTVIDFYVFDKDLLLLICLWQWNVRKLFYEKRLLLFLIKTFRSFGYGNILNVIKWNQLFVWTFNVILDAKIKINFN